MAAGSQSNSEGIFEKNMMTNKLVLKPDIQFHLCMTVSPDGEALENSLKLDDDSRLSTKELNMIASG